MKVGVITMFTPNCGSVLQAYATQMKLEDLGLDVEIINYSYPTEWHNARRAAEDAHVKSTDRGLVGFLDRHGRSLGRRLLAIAQGGRTARYLKRKFIKTKLNLSPVKYRNADELRAKPPVYDFYLTGSDQVWNPRFAVGDTVFMCDFAPSNAPRASYAASFATDAIPDVYRDDYIKHLAKYKAISVREKAGVKLVRTLTGMSAEVVCEPTLLIEKSTWDRVAEGSLIKVKKPYLLAYILTYAYDPFPNITRLIDEVRRQTGLDVVFLFGDGRVQYGDTPRRSDAAGPAEFVRLFRDASFVVTTSLHGTAFSLTFEKPFYSIVESLDGRDSRMLSLAREVGAESRVLPVTAPGIDVTEPDYSQIAPRLAAWRSSSIEYLQGVFSQDLPEIKSGGGC